VAAEKLIHPTDKLLHSNYAGYLVTAMATVVALETDPSSSVNGGSGEALKSSLMG